MNAEQFRELLNTIANSKDNEEKNAAEAAFIGMRDMSPSDAFLSLLINEAVTESPVQQHAQVLLRQDLNKNEEKAAIYRLGEQSLGNELMVKLLHYLASNPSDKLGEVVERYAYQEIQQGRVFQPILGFIQQGLGSSTPVRRLAAHLVQEITVWPGFRVAQLPMDFMGAVQQMCGDADVQVRLSAVRALGQLISNNEDEVGGHIIGEEKVGQLLRAMLSVTAAMISNPEEQTQAERALQAIVNTVSFSGSDVQLVTAEILDLAEQLSAAQLSDDFTRHAINIFGSLTESCGKARKPLRDRYSNFLAHQVIPRLVPCAEALEKWASGADDEITFQDNSVQRCAEQCLTDAAMALGKVVVNPILQKLMKEAITSQSPDVCMAALIGSAAASFGMGDVCTIKEINVFIDGAVKLSTHQHPRVRFEALNALGAFANTYGQKIRKTASMMIPVLYQGTQDQMPGIRVAAFASTTQVVQQFDYEQMYQNLEMLQGMIGAGLSQGIRIATSCLQILKTLCDQVDSEDLVPILSNFMPSILQQFSQIMEEIQTVEQLTSAQSAMVHALVAVISAAAISNTDLFQGCIDQIMVHFVSLLEKANQALIDDIFGEVVAAMSQLVEPFSTYMTPYINQMMAVFHNALNKEVIATSGQLSNDDDAVDILVINQQQNVLAFIADFMDANAAALVPYYSVIHEILVKFNPVTVKQTVIHYHAIGQLINLAKEAQADPLALFREYFPKCVALHMAGPEDTEVPYIDSIEILADAVDSFAIMNRSFFRMVRAGLQLEELDAIYAQMFEVASHSIDKANSLLIEEMEQLKISAEDMEHDEVNLEMEDTIEIYQDCLEVIGVSYLQFIKELNTSNTPQTYFQLSQVIQRFLQSGLDTKPHQICTIEGISLLSDIAEHLDAQTCTTFFTQSMEALFAILRDESHTCYDVYRNLFFAFYNYLKKTEDPQIAGNPEILGACLRLLDQLKEEGSAEALGAYDNICSFMLVAGKVTKQGPEYWTPLFKYCLDMDNDECEVRHACEFIIEEVNAGNPQIIGAGDAALKLLVRLFFGKFCSTFRNDPEDQKLNNLMIPFCRQHFQAIQKEATHSGKFVSKNFASFKQAVSK